MRFSRDLKNWLRLTLGIRSETDFYSQAGEDAIVWKIVSEVLGLTAGSYVDVGAYHPFRHSNTYLLYKAGWRGINIDPRPRSKAIFDRYRPDDINLEIGVAPEAGTLDYYVLSEDSTMNSFSAQNLAELGVRDQIREIVQVEVLPLNTILENHMREHEIDYLNIDAEGLEIEILTSIDLIKWSPKLVSIEQNGCCTLADILSSPTAKYLENSGYTAVAKNLVLRDVATSFYIQKRFLQGL